jgi:fructose-1-phosphate kinase PfkB-like protein
MQGAGIEEAIRWAMATGAAAATTWGTEPPKLEVVRELLPLVEIRRRQ